jgi:hypothetical protein
MPDPVRWWKIESSWDGQLEEKKTEKIKVSL